MKIEIVWQNVKIFIILLVAVFCKFCSCYLIVAIWKFIYPSETLIWDFLRKFAIKCFLIFWFGTMIIKLKKFIILLKLQYQKLHVVATGRIKFCGKLNICRNKKFSIIEIKICSPKLCPLNDPKIILEKIKK